MSQPMPQTPRAVVVRPPRRLLVTGAVAVLALTTPIFAVLYWLTIPAGTGAITFGAHLIALGAAAAAGMSYAAVRVEMVGDRILAHGLCGRERTVELSEVRDALLIEIYHGDGLETAPQLFLRDGDGGLLLRMRGQIWGRPALETVLERVGTPVKGSDTPMTKSEMRARWPHLLAWFEQHPHRILHRGVKKSRRS